MALAPLLYNITFDSQTRILYFWDKAGHEIYHCEIPPAAPSVPMGGVLTSTSDSVILVPVEQAGGSVEIGGYAYPDDGALLDMSWNFGGTVEEYSPAPTVYTAYFNRDESPIIVLQPNFWFPLYKDGSNVYADATKTYTPIALYDSSENVIQFNMSAAILGVDSPEPYLRLVNLGYEQPQNVKYITYTVS